MSAQVEWVRRVDEPANENNYVEPIIIDMIGDDRVAMKDPFHTFTLLSAEDREGDRTIRRIGWLTLALTLLLILYFVVSIRNGPLLIAT